MIASNHNGNYPIASARLLIGNEDFLISIFRIVPARHSHACRAPLLIPPLRRTIWLLMHYGVSDSRQLRNPATALNSDSLIPEQRHTVEDMDSGSLRITRAQQICPIASARLLIGIRDFLVSIFTIVPASVP